MSKINVKILFNISIYALFGFLGVFKSYAVTRTWDGGGSDNNWTTAANWSTDIAPIAGDDIVFSGSTRTTPSNDFAANTSFASITFSGNTAFTVSGNAIQISGGATAITASNTSGTKTISLNITFISAAPTITTSSGGTLAISGTIANGGFIITATGAGTASLSGVVSGTGSFTKSSTGTLELSATNTFTGGITLNAGILKAASSQAFGTIAGTITVAGGTIYNSKGSALALINYPFVLQASFSLSGDAGNFDLGSGTVTLQANVTITTAASGSDYYAFGGVVSGAFNIIHSNGGYLAFTNSASTFTGTYTENGNYGTYVDKLANLSATSSLGAPTTVANGTIKLGNGSNSFYFVFAGGASFSTDRVIDLSGTTGTVRFFNLMSNSYSATFTSNFTATGSGNKTLYLGGGNTANNTISGVIPNPASGVVSLNVDDGSKYILSGTNTYTGTTTITDGTLAIGAGSTTGSISNTSNIANAGNLIINRSDAYTYSGVISGAGTLTKQAAGTFTLTRTNTMSGVTTISAGTISIGAGSTVGSLASSNITNNSNLEFYRSDAITYANVISGTGTVKNVGSGTTTFTGANTYTGVTTISTGTLSIGSGSTTGSIAGASIVNNSALIVNRSNAITYSGIISGTGTFSKQGAGTLTLSGSNTYSGTSTITAGSVTLGVANAITSSSVILGGGTLTTGATTGFSNTTTGTLSVTATSTIALGTGAHSLVFGASNGASWTASQFIYITGWQGGYDGSASTGANPLLKTGTSAELSGTKLAQMRFVKPSNGNYYAATQLASGEIVPTSTVVPVVLLDFIAQKISQNQSKLVWSTSQEINNKLFEIESSTDGVNFEKIGEVNGSGTTNNIRKYEFNDFNYIDNLITYYRLKQIDFDIKFEYSPIISLNPENLGNKKSLIVYPNPVNKGQLINISNFEPENYPFTIEVYSVDGKLILAKEYFTKSDKIELNTENLNEGEYIIKLKSNSSILYNKFIVE